MTDAHQDVAGVVERLRNPGIRGKLQSIMELRLEAATLIESLSKALSEAEADAKILKSEKATLAGMVFERSQRANVAESRLSEAMKVIEPFGSAADGIADRIPDEFEILVRIDATPVARVKVDDFRAARRFLNAGKE